MFASVVKKNVLWLKIEFSNLFSLKGHVLNILGYGLPVISFATIELCCYIIEATIGNT